MLSPLLTGEVEPSRNTAKACFPSRVQHAFGVVRALWRNREGAPKAWHPAGIGFLTINEREPDDRKPNIARWYNVSALAGGERLNGVRSGLALSQIRSGF